MHVLRKAASCDTEALSLLPRFHTGDFYLILGHPFGSEAGNNDCDDIEFHHLFMRNFVEIEPSISFGAEADV